jgi:hypothetical protein
MEEIEMTYEIAQADSGWWIVYDVNGRERGGRFASQMGAEIYAEGNIETFERIQMGERV